MAFHPFDSFRNALTDMRQHPFQTVGRIASRAGGPLVGAAVDQGFRYYNGHHELPTSGTALDMTRNAGDQAMQQGMDRPLHGPSDNTALAGALSGNNDLGARYNSPTGNGGGYSQPPSSGNGGNGGFNMAQDYGQQHGSLNGLLNFLPSGGPQNYGTPNSTMSSNSLYSPRFNPIQSPGLGGLLDFLGPAPESGKLKERQNQGFAGSMLNGVSNFMVGGSPVINGVRPGMGNYNRFGGSSQAVVRGRTPGN